MDYLLIGNGVAGITAAETVRRHDAAARITMLAAEEFPFYQRTRLNEYIAGELAEDELTVRPPTWYAERRIEVVYGCRAVSGDPARRFIQAADGREFAYDRLLLATGSSSFRPPIVGTHQPGVFTLRSLADAKDIKEYALRARRAVLIGGGLLGLESGHALGKLGLALTVVEFLPRLLPRQLDEKGAARLQDLLQARGFRFVLGQGTREIVGGGEDAALKVVLADGRELAADLVLISAGVRAELDLARNLGLECDLGIKVDERMRTSQPEIYAAGDAAQWQGPPAGIWPAAFQQGRIAGANMAGRESVYQGTTLATWLKVVGIDLAAAGDIDAEGRLAAVVEETAATYRKIVLDQNRVVGCILLGASGGFNRLTALMASGEKVADPRRLLAELD